MAKQPMTVARDYRTHPLSKIDGGCTAVVEYKDGTSREYPDVKKYDNFVAAIWRNDNGRIARIYAKADPNAVPEEA